MNIVFSIDNNFIIQLVVAIISILYNSTKEDFFHFYILDSGLTEENKKKIVNLKKIKNFNITYIKINEDDFNFFPIYSYQSISTYFRIKIPSLINANKLLYLDADILVNKSLKPLYEIDISDRYAACVIDGSSNEEWFKQHIKNLNISKYFNAGVVLFNVKKMREDNIENKCIEFAKKYPEKLGMQDQDLLNIIFKENVIFADKIWNYLCNVQSNKLKNEKNVAITHFAGKQKPWEYNIISHSAVKWFYYLSKTDYNIALYKIITKYIKNYVTKKSLHLRKINLFKQCYFS